nr:hypothetical protein BaRGS_018761 [Batillaria attramentaria]
MFSAEKEEDTDFINSIRPLQPLHSSTGRFTSPISTSGYQSDLTVPMEDANLSQEFIETVIVNGEQYHVLKKVGRGGSAQVYMVFDAKKNVRALKVVDLEGAGPEVIDGFRNEISLLQRLHEYNEKLNRLYVILEFGETDLSGFFATRAKQQRGLDPTMIKFYWTEMLVAVNALHREGIIHSDLKPANFMLVAGNLKLIDFGIANALQQDKTSVLKDSRVGTPSYMSPEAIMAACDDGMDDSAEEKENMGANARPKYKHIKNNMCKLQAITNPNCEIKFPSIPDAHLMDVLQKCLTRDVKLRPTTQELLDHPYLTSDKDTSQNQTPPRDQGKASKSSNINKTPENKGESKILKELLQSKLAEGSPGMQALITKLMKKMETGQNVDTRAVLLDANNLTLASISFFSLKASP